MINILIVDDQKVVREQLTSYFEADDELHVVATATNGIEGLEKIKAFKPNLVFMDVEMPGGITGLEMTSMISNLHPETKVIILTGNYTEENGQQAVQVGAEVYLPKSTPSEQLIAIAKKVGRADALVATANSSHLNSGNTPNKIVSYSRQDKIVRDSNEELLAKKATPLYIEQQATTKKQLNLGKFVAWGIALNSLVWIVALAYLKLTPPTYTSQWGVKILETDSGVEVVLPDGGKATPAAGGWTPPTGQDPRNDYVYVATSPDLLAEAAARANMTIAEYQEPTIKVDEANGIIAFQIEGSTAEEAKAKAQVFHQTMTKQIEELRKVELARQKQETQVTLAEAKEKLVAAQAKLSQYRAASGISTDEQIKNLTDRTFFGSQSLIYYGC